MNSNTLASRRRPRWGAPILALGLMVGVSGCDELLQVKNPNDVPGEQTLVLSAADALVNGALSGVARGYASILTSYATATDEMEWVGSRDAFTQLDIGNFSDPFNEFTDAEFVDVAQGRWMADEAVRIVSIHAASTDPDSQLTNPENLGWAHLYAAISRITIGDMYDDFVFSDRAVSGSPFGAANMGQMYTDAVTNLTSAISIAQAEGDGDLETAATAMRARAYHGLAVWGKLNPLDLTNNGLVASTNAVLDANTVLADVQGTDYKYQFEYSSSTISADIGSWVNSRQEMRMGPAFTTPDPTDPTFIDVRMTDLIDVNDTVPELKKIIEDFAFNSSRLYPKFTMVGERELLLIIAEDELAAGTMVGFETAINDLRDLDGLTNFADGGAGMPTALALLQQARATNLFFGGRRLADLYRFGLTSPEWVAGSEGMNAPGTFFPIAVIECRANENIPENC